jgi:hypothetical protein
MTPDMPGTLNGLRTPRRRRTVIRLRRSSTVYVGRKVFGEHEWPAVRERQRTTKALYKPSGSDQKFAAWKCPDCDHPLEFHGGSGGGAGMVYLIFTCDTCRAVHTFK